MTMPVAIFDMLHALIESRRHVLAEWDGATQVRLGYVDEFERETFSDPPSSQLVRRLIADGYLVEVGYRGPDRIRSTWAVSPAGLRAVEAFVPQPTPAKRRAPQSRDLAAQIIGVSARYVQDAKKLSDRAPDLLDRVRTAEITIPEAMRRLRQRCLSQESDGPR